MRGPVLDEHVTRAGRRLLRHLRTYTLPGLWTALVFCALSFTPSLLPRPALYQGLVAGVTAALGYGVGVLGAWMVRALRDRPPRRPSQRTWRVLAATAAVLLVLTLVLAVRWQREAHRLAGTDPQSAYWMLLAPPLAVLFAVLLVMAGRGVRALYRRLSSLLARRMGPQAAKAIGVLSLVVAGSLLASGVLWNAALGAVDGSFSVRDLTTPRRAVQPTTELRSGGPGSLVPWDSLGREGRVFVGTGPGAADIEDFSGEPALEPIRTYAGLSSADDSQSRAELAVDDLERAGGFDRAELLVVVTTGTGWVEPSSVSSFEYIAGGDSAIVGMQYSHLPSWMSFLVDGHRAREAGRDLFDAVYRRWNALPQDQRPRLFVFGESLGSFGAEEAFSGEFDLANRTSGALFVGPPHFNPMYREFVDDRDEGSPEIEPVYQHGRIIRFSAGVSADVSPGAEGWPDSRVLYLQHASDPVTWWSPDLIFQRPDWLEEPRGADVPGDMRWVPLVTFWQVSADLALAFSTEPGHGHNFSGEHVAGWAAVLRPDGWTDERAAELQRIILGR